MNAASVQAIDSFSAGTREDRRFPRQPFTGRVTWLDGSQQECGALDISAGGMGLLMSERVAVGQQVDLALLSRSVAVRGIVAHVRAFRSGDWRVGIRFLSEEPEVAEVALAAS